MTDKKKFSIADLSKDSEWKKIQMLDVDKDPYTDLLYDYQKKAMDDIYKRLGTNLCEEITFPNSYKTVPVTCKPTSNANLSTKNPPAQTTMSVKELTDWYKLLNTPTTYNTYNSGYPKTSWGDYETYFKSAPMVSRHEKKVEVEMEDGSIESVSREDLIKYIREQKIVQENEVVRKVYERYQVAVKLVRSDDNGDTGV